MNMEKWLVAFTLDYPVSLHSFRISNKTANLGTGSWVPNTIW